VGLVAHMGTGVVHTGFWWGNLRERTTWKTNMQIGDNIKKDNFNGFHPVVCIYINNNIYYRLTQL
jgi:hypothetical protein